MTPSKALREGVYIGAGIVASAHILFEDGLGLEGYVGFMRRHWIDLHWGWGLAFLIACVASFVFSTWVLRLEEKNG